LNAHARSLEALRSGRKAAKKSARPMTFEERMAARQRRIEEQRESDDEEFTTI
jgi:hypothetical protein